MDSNMFNYAFIMHIISYWFANKKKLHFENFFLSIYLNFKLDHHYQKSLTFYEVTYKSELQTVDYITNINLSQIEIIDICILFYLHSFIN